MLRKYLTLLRMCWNLSMEYRGEGLIWMMGSLMSVIMLVVWLSIGRGGPVNGFTPGDFVAYYMVALLVRQLTAVWSAWTLSSDIREGRLSSQLLRPLHPIHMEIANNWAEKVLRVAILVPIIVVVFAITPDALLALRVTPLTVLAFLLSVLGAWALCFLSDYVTGLLSFWTTQGLAFTQVWWDLRLVLSGMLLPIQMFPPALQAVFNWLPFRYMLGFSADIVLGRATGDQIAFGLLAQFAWVVLFGLVVRVLWRLGVRSYSAVGA
jgi:ABC-2 type transport system permease protein